MMTQARHNPASPAAVVVRARARQYPHTSLTSSAVATSAAVAAVVVAAAAAADTGRCAHLVPEEEGAHDNRQELITVDQFSRASRA